MKSGEKTDTKANIPETHVVAVGASAGGLEAIHDFFDNMPEADRLSFVVIQHLSPDYKSLLVDLVSKHTHMKVQETTNATLLRPGTVYVIPPGKIITLKNKKLVVEDKVGEKGRINVIDTFLLSMAQDIKDKGIAVILSGTGSDGTKGCEEVRKNGGLVLVQDPITAKFDGMPNSIINTGHLDFILAPELMPVQIYDHINEELPVTLLEENKKNEALLDEIFKLLYKHTGCDFQYYKKPTILRRIARRMAHHKHETLAEYVDMLRSDVEENNTLCKDFLIGVTKFFRDKEAFDLLNNTILPRWTASADRNDAFKVWVAGCSTGQEAYSIAMCVHDFFTTHNIANDIKIFASDIDQSAIDTASKGAYSLSIDNEVPSDFLKKYFVREGDKYHVTHELRKLIVFAKHNIITDPPFIRNDFLSCRNMLIYMDISLQKKVLSTLYFSMKPGGYLMLGPSETASILSENLDEIDRKWKVFQKLQTGKKQITLHHPYTPEQKLSKTKLGIRPASETSRSYDNIFKDVIAKEYKFAGIFIDKNFNVKEAIGDYRSYLSLPEKSFHLNITKMIPSDLGIALNSALRKCANDKEKVEVNSVKVKSGDKTSFIDILIHPPSPEHLGYYFIVLHESNHAQSTSSLKEERYENVDGQNTDEYIQALKEELHDTESNLQHAIENLETANQELQSTNEEMLSANEELQSSNEELQSLNEELHTLNTEHQQKINELIVLNDDLNNYLRNSEVGQVFIDNDLRVRKFNPVSTRMVNLIESDIDRPLTHISTNLLRTDLTREIKSVLQTNVPVEKEVELTTGSICLMRINPYIKQDKTSDGVVVSFIDISKLKELNSLVKATFNSSTNPIIALKAYRDEENTIKGLYITTTNDAAAELIGRSRIELVNCALDECFPYLYDSGIYTKLFHIIESGEPLQTEFKDSYKNSWFELSAVKMREGLVVTLNDITKLKLAERELLRNVNDLEAVKKELELSNQDLQQFASVASHDMKEPLRKIQLRSSILQSSVSEKLSEAEQKQFATVMNAAERMRMLIDDLLEFSKLSSEPEFEVVDMNAIIADCLSDLEVLIEEKNAAIDYCKFPKIDGVPQKLRQLFQNLLSNALKFSKDDTAAKINIECERVRDLDFDTVADETGPYFKFTIADNGIGFEQYLADKVFTMFHRLSKTKQGTGIGLAICKKIVEQHKGIIRALSTPGEGTTFEIIIPVNQKKAHKLVKKDDEEVLN